MQALRLVHPEKLPGPCQVGCHAELHEEVLIVNFDVRTSGRLSINRALSTQSAQWGLWDWDVVELFLSVATPVPGLHLPYFEFQVSPLNQYFELQILEPRKILNHDFKSGFRHEAKILPGQGWSARMEVPLTVLGWDRDPKSIVGSAFAILGQPEARSYWSQFFPPQEVPDFHLPGNFKKLLAPEVP